MPSDNKFNYRPTPFNLVTLLCIIVIVKYFIDSGTTPGYDRGGWIAAFMIIPAFMGGALSIAFDIGLRKAFGNKNWSKLMWVEGAIVGLFIVMFLYSLSVHKYKRL